MWSYVAPWKRGEMDVAEFIREASRQRVDGVELLDFFWKDRTAETESVRNALEETGLSVGVYSVSNDFVNSDPLARTGGVDIIKRGVDSALEFGARTVRVFAGDVKSGISFDEAMGWIIDGLSESAAYAQQNGVDLALENHGALAGRSDQVLTILNAVANPVLGANPDTGNFVLVHEASHLAVAALASRAKMVHFKDFKVVADDFQGNAYEAIDGLKFAGTAIGEGDVDLPDCLKVILESGFGGWLNIEYEANEDPLIGVARSISYTRTLLNQF